MENAALQMCLLTPLFLCDIEVVRVSDKTASAMTLTGAFYDHKVAGIINIDAHASASRSTVGEGCGDSQIKFRDSPVASRQAITFADDFRTRAMAAASSQFRSWIDGYSKIARKLKVYGLTRGGI